MAQPSVLSAFLARINHPVLTPEQEKDLFLEFRESAGSEKFRLKQKIISHNLRLVVHFCKQYRSPHGHSVPLEDLIQAGYFGLDRAIELFDPHRGTKFSTYAKHWIFCCVNQEVCDKYAPGGVRIQAKVLQGRNRLHRELPGFKERYGHAPTPEEIKKIIGEVSLDQIRSASARYISADQPATDESTLLDLLPDPESLPLPSPQEYERLDQILSQASAMAGINPEVVALATDFYYGVNTPQNLKAWKRLTREIRRNPLAASIVKAYLKD